MKIIIEGNPIPQRRPEVRIWNGKVRGYDPSAQKKEEIKKQLWAEKKIKEMYKDCPLRVKVEFYMAIPKSLSLKKQKELENQYHIKRPDLDNLYKLVTDLLEGMAYNKDECICDFSGVKRYSSKPRTEITIEKLM